MILFSLTEPLEVVSKHEWYHVVTNCLGSVFSHHCLPKVAKICQKKTKVDFRVNYYTVGGKKSCEPKTNNSSLKIETAGQKRNITGNVGKCDKF